MKKQRSVDEVKELHGLLFGEFPAYRALPRDDKETVLLCFCDTRDVIWKTHHLSKVLGPLAMMTAAVFSPFNSLIQTLPLVISSGLSMVLLIEMAHILYFRREFKVMARAIDETGLSELQKYQGKPWPSDYLIDVELAERIVQFMARRT